MANGTLQAVMQQVGVLSTEDKRALTAWLLEQMKPDAAPVKPNGQPPLPSDEPDPSRRREMRWLAEHRDEYAGQVVALWGDRLVAHGTDWKSVLTQARAAGVADPLMAEIEAADELPSGGYGGWAGRGN